MMGDRFRVGDVLTVSCPFTEAVVAQLMPFHVALEWPWHRVDPDAPQFQWNGQYAISTDPAHADWKGELFRTEPAPPHLKTGTTCRVGIPLTVVHVLMVVDRDPPEVNGMLPRPSLLLGVLPAGQSEDLDDEDQGCTLAPDDDIPTDIRLLFRPYAFLEYGDRLTDRSGRTWRFDGPWQWHREDDDGEGDSGSGDGSRGDGDGAPEWPLTLTDRNGEPDPNDATAVYEATKTGSHTTEAAWWSQLTDATPLSRTHH